MLPQRPSPQPLPSPQTKRRPLVLGGALLLAGLLAGAVLGGLGQSPPGDDGLTDQQAASRRAEFAAAGGIALAAVPTGETAAAIAVMQLPPDQASAVRQAVEAGTLRLAYLTLWDDMAEDGDAVRVSAAGFAQEVALRKAPLRVTVPLAGGAGVTLTGIRDGQGGITAALLSGQTRVLLPHLRVGQSVPIPVR